MRTLGCDASVAITVTAAAVLLLARWRRRRATTRYDALTYDDSAWLQAHQHRKVLDARVRIVGVAARDADG